MKGDDISERLVDFSVRIIRVVKALNQDFVSQHMAKQLLRSGTSAGANYEEARGSESSADFIHKMRLALKELRETLYWLRLIGRAEMLTEAKLKDITAEAYELANIIGKSIITAQNNLRDKSA